MNSRKEILFLAFCLLGNLVATINTPACKAASTEQIYGAIALGLDFLNRTQAIDGHWGGSYYPIACTAMAVLAFENIGHLPGNASDPYSSSVEKGLDYLFEHAKVQNLTNQTAGNPDTNLNGLGVYLASSDTIYQTPMVLMAIVASQSQERIATSGPANVSGRSYRDIAVDIVDWITWAQNEAGAGRGGWRYEPNYSTSDNSNTQWPLLGLLSARLWGIEAPMWVKDELLLWLNRTQSLSGNASSNSFFGSFGYDSVSNINSIAETATGILGLTYCGLMKDDQRIVAAQGYIVRDWNSNSGWRSNFANLYAMYAVMKACRLTLPTPITHIVNYTATPTLEWYNGTGQYADWLVANQKVDGHWEGTQASTNDDLNTAWGVLILEYVPVVVKYTLTVMAIDDITNSTVPGANVTIVGPETRSNMTDAEGKTVFRDVQAGVYAVSIFKAGYALASMNVDLYADKEVVNTTKRIVSPTSIETCDSSGVTRRSFLTNGEAVYVCGNGYEPQKTYSICIVETTEWIDGMLIPSCISNTALAVTSDSSGNIHPTVVWGAPLTTGRFDVIIDTNDNGRYDAYTDALYVDFIVVESYPSWSMGMSMVLILAFAGVTCFGLIAFFIVLAYFQRRKRRHRPT